MFDRFFQSDNPLWTAMGKIFDLFILNCLLLICSVPVITIGPALTGFYYALINMARDEEISVTKEFFTSFRRNFRQGIFLGIPFTLLIAFLILDIWLCRNSGTGIYTFFMVFFFILLMITCFTAFYAFPILAKFDKTNREILIWAFTLSISHLGRTLLMLFMGILGAWFTHLLPGLLFIIFGLEGLFQASQLIRILEPYLPEHFENKDQNPTIEDNVEASGLNISVFDQFDETKAGHKDTQLTDMNKEDLTQ